MPPVSFTINHKISISYYVGLPETLYRTITFLCHVNWGIFRITFKCFAPQIRIHNVSEVPYVTNYLKAESIDRHHIPLKDRR